MDMIEQYQVMQKQADAQKLAFLKMQEEQKAKEAVLFFALKQAVENFNAPLYVLMAEIKLKG